jgi:hypothetical protein
VRHGTGPTFRPRVNRVFRACHQCRRKTKSCAHGQIFYSSSPHLLLVVLLVVNFGSNSGLTVGPRCAVCGGLDPQSQRFRGGTHPLTGGFADSSG